jgi:hypothetical protein
MAPFVNDIESLASGPQPRSESAGAVTLLEKLFKKERGSIGLPCALTSEVTAESTGLRKQHGNDAGKEDAIKCPSSTDRSHWRTDTGKTVQIE